MVVGVCKLSLIHHAGNSLKAKRGVIRRIKDRVANRYNVSVAEVGDQELWQLATIGICYVSNNRRYTNEVLSKVVDFIVNSRFDVEILDYEIEILPVF